MRVFLRITLLFLISFMMSSCIKGLSDLRQITANTIECDVDESQAEYYYEKYGKNNQKMQGSEELKKETFQKLSNMPEEYLEYSFVKHNIDFILNVYPGATTSWTTTMSDGYNSLSPLSITITFMSAVAHEFGHATEGLFWDRYASSFRSDLSSISALIAQKYQAVTSWYLRTYANQSQASRDAETFAELFDTWHCSSKAREVLKEGMPEVYAFGEKYLGSNEQTKDINVLFTNKGSNPRLYFANNNDYSEISYCISSSDSECDERLSVSKYTSKEGNDNIFVSKNLNVSGSFTVFVYGDDSLVRKISISSNEHKKIKG